MQHLNENARLKEVIATVNRFLHTHDEVTSAEDQVTQTQEPRTAVSSDREIPVAHEPSTQVEYTESTQPNPGTASIWQKSHGGDIFRSINNGTGEVTTYNRHTLPQEGKDALGIV